MTLALSNQISILAPDGTEPRRLSGPMRTADGTRPWDMPANIAFDDTSGTILVTNHAQQTGATMPERFAVFDVYIGEPSAPVIRPILP